MKENVCAQAETTGTRTEERVSLSVRISVEEMEIIKRASDINCRTVSDQLRFMIRQLSEETRR